MTIKTGKNYIVTHEIHESDESDHFDEGERVVAIGLYTVLGANRVLIKNRIGSKGWIDASILNPARGRPMKVMV